MMKSKIKYIIVLIIMATIGVIIFQLSWLQSSYLVSKEKAKIDVSRLLEESMLRHQELVADTVRGMLRRAIRPQDIETPAHYKMEDSEHVSLSYRTKLTPNGAWTTFEINRKDLTSAQQKPYAFLLRKLETFNFRQLRNIYGALVGGVDYAPLSVEEKLQDSLWRRFDLIKDTATVNRILAQKLDSAAIDLKCTVFYFKKIEDVYLYQPKTKETSMPGTRAGIYRSELATEEVANGSEVEEQVMVNGPAKTLTADLDSLSSYVDRINTTPGLSFIVKPILDDINHVLLAEIPVIMVKIYTPRIYLIKQMAISVVASIFLLLLICFCLCYMFYFILKQKKLSEIKDDFIGNISHELKTPVATALAAVHGMQFFDVLKSPEKTNRYLATTAGELKRLSLMIDAILNNAVFDRTNFNLQLKQFNLKTMLVNVIDNQQLHVDKEVVITLDYHAEDLIYADETHFYNVMSNLVDNAIKYSKGPVAIQLFVEKSDNGIKILISDNGIGIPKNYHRHIFEKFFRVPSPNDHSVKGYGLGLHYVQNIVQLHHGTVSLTKSDSNGTTFKIELPQ